MEDQESVVSLLGHHATEAELRVCRQTFRHPLVQRHVFQHFDCTVVQSRFKLLYLLLEVVDVVCAAVPVLLIHTIWTIRSTEFEPLAVLGTIRQIVNHELALHVVIQRAVGDGKGFTAVGASPAEQFSAKNFLSHIGVKIDIDTLPEGKFSGMAAGRAGDGAFAYFGHNL